MFKFQVGQRFLMYVSETTLGPLRITPVAEATNARTSVAFSDPIAEDLSAWSALLRYPFGRSTNARAIVAVNIPIVGCPPGPSSVK